MTCLIIFWILFSLASRSAFFIVSTIVMDLPNNQQINQSSELNFNLLTSNDTNSLDPHKQRNVVFVVLCEWITSILVTSIPFLFVYIRTPSKLLHNERLKMKYIVCNGIATGFSNYLYTCSASALRTPPYLSGILGNVAVPFQFIVRYLLIRKMPTFIKLMCASVIVAAEIVSLIPTIFPNLESSSAHRDDGGSKGWSGILWPLCFIAAIIPNTIANGVIELATKNEVGTADGSEKDEMDEPDRSKEVTVEDLFYYTFWWCVFGLCTFLCLSWTDVIPYFGTSASLEDMLNNVKDGVLCVFGATNCSTEVIALLWSLFVLRTCSVLSVIPVVRYSEGSSFFIIVLSLRTPLIFLFWSLFVGDPFHWHPHTHLSTWLSIGAIVVMIPAVVIYDRGDIWYEHYAAKANQDFTQDNQQLITAS